MLLVTGPTGNVEHELVDLLKRRHRQPWRVGSRHPERLPRATTAETMLLDFFDPTTWAAAVAGVDELFLLFPLPSNRAARHAIVPVTRSPPGTIICPGRSTSAPPSIETFSGTA